MPYTANLQDIVRFMLFALIMYLLGLEVRYREGMVVKKNSFQAFLFAARPNTLTASIAPVLVGVTLAALDMKIAGTHFSWTPYILCLGFAIGMQIASNLINDLYDFKKGADGKDRLGPVRVCSMGWVDVEVMKKWIAIILILASCFGFPLVFYGGYSLIMIGVICVVCAFLYTTYLSYHGFGDILVLVFFGIIPVCFMYYVETLIFTVSTLVISLGVGLVVDTLLLVNNYRDVENDTASGKRTLAVLFGRKVTSRMYLLFGLAGPLSTIVLVAEGFYIPSLVASPYIVFHLLAYRKMILIGKGRELNRILEKSATNIFIFAFLLSAGLLIQRYLIS